MNVNDSPVAPGPPNLISALFAGFEAIANQIALILFPVVFDLLIWLGPHLRVRQLVDGFIQQITSSPGWDAYAGDEMLMANTELLKVAAERLNLMSILRSYPVGIPSLMAGRLPIEVPNGALNFWELSSWGWIVVIWILLTVIGLIAGTLYYLVVAQAALAGQVSWRQAFMEWPRASLQVLLLFLLLGIFLLSLSIPSSCLISVFAAGGLLSAQISMLIFGGVLLWLFFPLILSPQGIFAKRYNVLVAIKNSVSLTRMTLPTTGLLFLAILVLSQGLDLLWRVPEETSWLTLLGVAGHAFVATSLLAATFIYYRDADRWVQNVLRKMRISSGVLSNGRKS